MIKKQINIEKEYGADLVPLLVQSACHYDCQLHIIEEEKNINMKSIMGMTILKLAKGTRFELVAEGRDEERAANELAACFE